MNFLTGTKFAIAATAALIAIAAYYGLIYHFFGMVGIAVVVGFQVGVVVWFRALGKAKQRRYQLDRGELYSSVAE